MECRLIYSLGSKAKMWVRRTMMGFQLKYLKCLYLVFIAIEIVEAQVQLKQYDTYVRDLVLEIDIDRRKARHFGFVQLLLVYFRL